ncbi:ferritin-like domain-containing protein [Pedobacter metabolipauper]|uniref:Ferritin-like protein n=1 Tax=Pedobacter metabolipauper TaxID=425513 RepID=A0A4R6SRT6_9SPHI|nr:ferritin-like domain-containing protein [Pedobacter metabolipauper]TDQ06425.1 ferritin-like protein [Pedobacter metabolipauper]
MKNLEKQEQELLQEERSVFTAPLQRRSFLQFAGAGAAGVALVAAGCKKDRGDLMTSTGVTLDFKDDFGILNYAYALEQLEAAFYVQVVKTPYASMPANELALLTDIRDHEVAHREFFKNALSTAAIGSLEVNFSKIDFSSRASVLGTAKAFEDLGVSAYNGAGKMIKSVDYLLLAGKIVSVEARHAALIRDLLENGTFANTEVVAASTGLDTSRTPAAVLAIAGGFIKTEVKAINL